MNSTPKPPESRVPWATGNPQALISELSKLYREGGVWTELRDHDQDKRPLTQEARNVVEDAVKLLFRTDNPPLCSIGGDGTCEAIIISLSKVEFDDLIARLQESCDD